ncbi:MAG: type II toxin-antitoxin system HicB family antitoxin [Armatimonadetes bacterium]|nr:type II toxin-antitoxin system HicB family antitoxin [Armatimonadota bacterium]
MNKFLVIIERGETSYGAYSPDLPGCIAVGQTMEEVEARMLNAMHGHIAHYLEKGQEIPVPTTAAAFIVALPISGARAKDNDAKDSAT